MLELSDKRCLSEKRRLKKPKQLAVGHALINSEAGIRTLHFQALSRPTLPLWDST